MGIFNALGVAVSGMNAQGVAFENLGNNIANSQTVGYKADSTAFQDFVSGSLNGPSGLGGVSKSVGALTVQHVDRQGSSAMSTDHLALSISGGGLFNVSQRSGQATSGLVQFSGRQYYTRNGEFYEDKNGYLVNTSGYYLNGYMADPRTGRIDNNLTQINVSNVVFRPTQTTLVTQNSVIGTLPGGTGGTNTPQHYTTPSVTAYSANGQPYQMGLEWIQSPDNPLSWKVSAYSYSASGDHSAIIGPNSVTVSFNPDGTMKSLSDESGHIVNNIGAKARLAVPVSYDGVSQNVTVDFGTIGGKTGTVMGASTGTPGLSGVGLLSVDDSSRKISAADVMKIGTTTGSEQSYMTAPVSIGTSGNTTSAKWIQTTSSPPGWTVQMVDPRTNTEQSDVYNVVFNTDGSVRGVTNARTGATGSLSNLSATVDGQGYSVDLGEMSLTTDASLPSDVSALKTDSVTNGNYTGVEIGSDGSVVANFDNGATQLIGKVALSNFANVNGLHAVDGQAYTVTAASGEPHTGYVGENGTGTLSVGYVEGSTTDLTKDLSSLIVAQQAYTANTKVVSTADALLQTTIAMKT